jgi:urea transport system substrate-binding protein
VADSVSYDGPRGELHMRDRHVDQRVYLAEADDIEFNVIAQL